MTAAPRPTEPPLPALTPVAGTATTTVTDASDPAALGLPDDGADGDTDPVVLAVSAALDAFLESAQQGAPDLSVLGASWVVDVAPDAAQLLTTGITTRDNPVLTAAYAIDVQVEAGLATLATAHVTVQRTDGTSVAVELVFELPEGQPLLLAVGNGGPV